MTSAAAPAHPPGDDALVAAWLAAVRAARSARTVEAYAGDVLRFATHVRAAGRTLADADADLVRGWLAALERDGMCARTRARKHSVVRSLFAWLAARGHVAANPAAAVAPTPRGARLATTPRADAAVAAAIVAQAAGNHPRAVAHRAMLEVLRAGLSAGEVVGAALAHYDAATGALRVAVFGARLERRVTLTANGRAALARYLAGPRVEWAARVVPARPELFLSERGRGLTRQGFWKIVQRYARAAGVAPMPPASLRGTSGAGGDAVPAAGGRP